MNFLSRFAPRYKFLFCFKHKKQSTHAYEPKTKYFNNCGMESFDKKVLYNFQITRQLVIPT